MHSIREMGGTDDVGHGIKLLRVKYINMKFNLNNFNPIFFLGIL